MASDFSSSFQTLADFEVWNPPNLLCWIRQDGQPTGAVRVKEIHTHLGIQGPGSHHPSNSMTFFEGILKGTMMVKSL